MGRPPSSTRSRTTGAKIGVITSGVAYQYVKEAMGDKVNYCKLGLVWPLPEKLLLDFAARCETVYVAEELDDFIETHCKALGMKVIGKDLFPRCGELSQKIVRKLLSGEEAESLSLEAAIPVRPPVMCCGCPHRGVFYALKRAAGSYVSGDIGCYTLGATAPLSAMDASICMGASVSALHGFNKARGPEAEKKSVAVIGDSTFAPLRHHKPDRHCLQPLQLRGDCAGQLHHRHDRPPAEPHHRFLTSRASPPPPWIWKHCATPSASAGSPWWTPTTLKQVMAVLKEELAAQEPSVIISRRPCALLKYVKHNPPLSVAEDKCVGCKACLGIGCPAISYRNGKAVIDGTQCVGCGVCESLCPKGAIG